jgi:hypothetical protein
MDPQQQLSRQAIAEFKEIYLEEFGKVLSNDEAQEMALRLLQLLESLQRLSDLSSQPRLVTVDQTFSVRYDPVR